MLNPPLRTLQETHLRCRPLVTQARGRRVVQQAAARDTASHSHSETGFQTAAELDQNLPRVLRMK